VNKVWSVVLGSITVRLAVVSRGNGNKVFAVLDILNTYSLWTMFWELEMSLAYSDSKVTIFLPFMAFIGTSLSNI
jgi:hypothetical protein